MFLFINPKYIQMSTTSKPSADGGTTYMNDMIPNVDPDNEFTGKPLCRVYAKEEVSIKGLIDNPFKIKCTNKFNEISKNVNTNFDILDSNTTGATEKFNDDKYIIIAVKFNGVITSFTIDDRLEVLNGCFAKLSPSFSAKVKGKPTFSKVLYLIVHVKSDESDSDATSTANVRTIVFNTESVGKNKESGANATNMYKNTLSFDISDIRTDIEYVAVTEKLGTKDCEEGEFVVPKFSSLLNPRIDTVIKHRENNNGNRKNSSNSVYQWNNGITVKDKSKKSKSSSRDANNKLKKYKDKYSN